ncbi:MAG: mechanosensitive ion channel family protein [Cyclobacteriaceae bacterium]
MDNKIFTGEYWLEVANQFLEWSIINVPGIILIILLGLVASKVLNFLLKRVRTMISSRLKKEENAFESEKRADTLLGILKGVSNLVIWTIVIMLILEKLTIEIGPLLAGVGIVGLAVGFGAQELVRDIITGFFILLENHIRKGDVAILNGTGGLVENIGLRTVILRDFAGVVHVFQNGKINSLSNMTKEWSAMVFDIGVAYKENTDKVSEIIQQVGDELQQDEKFKEKILEPIEVFGVENFADSAVIIKARLKTKPIEQWTVGREFRGRLKKAFDAQGIEIPFPHRTVYWGEEIKPLQINRTEEAS